MDVLLKDANEEVARPAIRHTAKSLRIIPPRILYYCRKLRFAEYYYNNLIQPPLLLFDLNYTKISGKAVRPAADLFLPGKINYL
jgi:hypothetical protein